jgi:predicted MFS family arabinose efflux permease
MFVGFSAGAALGSLTVARSSAAYLGLVGATCEVAALLLLPATSPRSTAFSVKA